MHSTSGSADVRIGLIDGPVDATCSESQRAACTHGTFIANLLTAPRNASVPGICPGCTLVIRPVFSAAPVHPAHLLAATPAQLAAAILQCVGAGARVINLSLSLAQASARDEPLLEEAINQAARRGVLVVAAAGNQGLLGSSAILRHPWVIPVAACDGLGRPMHESNYGSSIGRRGLSAVGDRVSSTNAAGTPTTLSGTSVAVPFVTGAIALLWSAFPGSTAAQIRHAINPFNAQRRVSVVPPLLDAEAARQILSVSLGTKQRRSPHTGCGISAGFGHA